MVIRRDKGDLVRKCIYIFGGGGCKAKREAKEDLAGSG